MSYEAYEPEMQEIREWLADGPKADDEFDEWMSEVLLGPTITDPETGMRKHVPVIKKCSPRRMSPGTVILGTIPSGIGPDSWGGRLDLLHHMCREGEVKATESGDHIVYELSA